MGKVFKYLYSPLTYMYWFYYKNYEGHRAKLVYMNINPLGTVDGYSSSSRDATGPVDVYSRILTSTQVMCIAA